MNMGRKLWQAFPGTLLILASVIGACRGRADTGGANESASRTDTAAVGADTAAATTEEFTDANIAALLDEANKADSSAGAAAVKKASSPEVKKFARMMMGDHHALRVAGEKVVKQAKITPSAPTNDPVAPLAQQETSVLDSTPAGPGFDRAYIDQEVAAHRAVKDLLERSEGEADNPDLKAVIGKARPVVDRHLKEAEELQHKLVEKA
jgi:putative membrane protein